MAHLTVEVPPTFPHERDYVLSVVLSDFLGLEYQRQVTDRQDIRISCDDRAELAITDKFFLQDQSAWLTPASLPVQPLRIWDFDHTGFQVPLVSTSVPIVYGTDATEDSLFSSADATIRLGLDIFGSAFFMLTRYEEAVKGDRDLHNRFPATASLAYQEGFLDRPIVNEYVEILWACMKKLWPHLQRRNRQFKVVPSHDVDRPFAHAFASTWRASKRFAGDFILRQNVHQALKNMRNWLEVKSGHLAHDPFDTFDLIMDVSERENLRSAFYFIADHTAIQFDGDYKINHPTIRRLLRKIYQRGHEIGLHASYGSYLDADQTQREFNQLRQVCAEEGIEQNAWGGRQHFLRWCAPATWRNWEKSGLSYDSTLSFADISGFRCGVCYDYPAYDVVERRVLQIRECPLIVMECTVIDDRYMGYGPGAKALELVTEYKRRCQMFDGSFTLLWHNDRFVDVRERSLYEEILRN